MKRVYRVLLRAYPTEFRDAYEEELVAFFEEQRRDPRYAGPFGKTRLWLAVVADVLRNAIRARNQSLREHAKRRKKRTGEFTMGRDLRHAVRRLLHAPGFSLAAILTLALGIGAATAIFSVVHAVVISPLPYPESERLVRITHAAPGADIPRLGFSLGTYVHYREHNRAFDEMAVYESFAVNLTGDGAPERVDAAYVSYTFFNLFQKPVLGRAIEEEDDRPGAGDVVVLSHRLWQQRYGSDADIVGTNVLLDGNAFRIIGVMPARFDVPTTETALWVPWKLDPERVTLGGFSRLGIGRLSAGVTPAEAQNDLESLLPRFAERFADRSYHVIVENAGLTPLVIPLKDEVVGDVARMRFVLVGTVGLILLIACANVANLFIVRAEGRRREVAIQTALGAGRARIARQFLVESIVLAVVGGALGIVLTYAAIDALVRLGPDTIPRLHEVRISSAVLGFASLSSVGAGLVFGLVGIMRFGARSLPVSLKDGGRGSTVGRERHRAALATLQVALALVLLVGAGLLVKSFWYLRKLDPGFDQAGVLTFRLTLPDIDYPDRVSTAEFQQRVIDRLTSLPGVSAVGAVTCLPLTGCRSVEHVQREDAPTEPGSIPPPAQTRGVTAGYFEALGIPLVEGRFIERRDHEDKTGVLVVSRTFAERWWPGESALGKRVYAGISDSPPWYRVVGVVGNVPTGTLTDEPEEVLYFPMIGRDESIHVPRSMAFAMKVDGDPELLVPVVRHEISTLDSSLPIANVRTLADIVSDARAPSAFSMVLIAIAALVALVLGAIGVYGVQSYMVSQRTGEIGVRMALGASAADVSRMVLWRAGLMALGGVVLGWGAALFVTRWMQSLLFDVPASDLATYGAASATLLAAMLAASYLPARRAASQDPTTALRSE
jgi:putative ABC transport system permease protein